MRNSHKILAGAAIVGLAVAGGAAFTGTGVNLTAPASQFIGGTVSQTVTGATLTNVQYGFTDSTNTAISSVSLSFDAAAQGETVSIAFAGSPSAFVCQDIQPSGTSLCTPDTGELPASGVTGIDITVV